MFQDLPDELVLKILSFSKLKDLTKCGQVSKRIRKISHDGTLWMTVNLEKKTVTTEFLEMILRNGCRILKLGDSTILGSLSSNMKSQLRCLNLSQLKGAWSDQEDPVVEELISSSSSLKHLVMEGVYLTPKMAVSICKNGKTLQMLNLNSSDLDFSSSYPYSSLQEIIKCCQELREVDLNVQDGLNNEDLEFLARNISPNVEKLNLSKSCFTDDHVKTLLSRCNKIKALTLEATWINVHSLTINKQRLIHTLEEFSLGPNDDSLSSLHSIDKDTIIIHRPAILPQISSIGFLELKSMPKLKILNLYYKKDDCNEIQNLRQHLPHLIIKSVLNLLPGTKYNINLIYKEK